MGVIPKGIDPNSQAATKLRINRNRSVFSDESGVGRTYLKDSRDTLHQNDARKEDHVEAKSEMDNLIMLFHRHNDGIL